MNIEEITERATQKPFRPFAMETVGGSWLDVETEAKIYLPPARPDIVIVFDANGRMYILGVEQISAIEVK